jgi:integrase
MGRPSKGGFHKDTKKLADGSRVSYWYAWKGGPRLPGQPGSREFREAYKAAIVNRREDIERPRARTLESIVDGYLDSENFRSRAERTKTDYRKLARLVVANFGDLELDALAGERIRGKFLDWRDVLAKRSLRQADYAWTFLNIVLNWGKARAKIAVNPCADAKVRKLYNESRVDKTWSDAQVEAFALRASDGLRLALNLALWTGQRQGDLLALPWSAYDGRYIRLAQGKSGGRIKVTIPVAGPLKAALDATPRQSPRMLVNSDGVPWTPDGFRVMWLKTCKRAGVLGVTFHDLRGTAVTRLAVAGATEPQIATITGHTLARVRSILDANYLHRDVRLAEEAIRKLEAYVEGPRAAPGHSELLSQPIDFVEAKNRRFGTTIEGIQ